jgi:hypothetical protein
MGLTQKMEAFYSFKALVSSYMTIQCQNSEERNISVIPVLECAFAPICHYILSLARSVTLLSVYLASSPFPPPSPDISPLKVVDIIGMQQVRLLHL